MLNLARNTHQDWERIYLEEGKEALLEERREEDLIAENQRLRMENDYLKKLNALVLEEERQNKKHK